MDNIPFPSNFGPENDRICLCTFVCTNNSLVCNLLLSNVWKGGVICWWTYHLLPILDLKTIVFVCISFVYRVFYDIRPSYLFVTATSDRCSSKKDFYLAKSSFFLCEKFCIGGGGGMEHFTNFRFSHENVSSSVWE